MHTKRMDWQHLIPQFRGLDAGTAYQVHKSFVDADGDEHQVGEIWLLAGSMFSKFDDLVTLCVTQKDDVRCELPLIWRPGAQDKIVENFSEYLARS